MKVINKTEPTVENLSSKKSLFRQVYEKDKNLFNHPYFQQRRIEFRKLDSF